MSLNISTNSRRIASPIDKKHIYLDNAADSPILPEIAALYPSILSRYYGNPSAQHNLGFQNRQTIETIEEEILALAGIPTTEANIIWTSGGTEANNLAILGNRENFSALSSVTEHASIHAPLIRREQQGLPVFWVRVTKDGAIDLQHFDTILQEKRPRIISIHHVQNETGVIQDIPSIRKIIDKHNPQALLHVDAIQSFGKIPLPWKSGKIDFLSFSSHKVHGPGSLGGLIIRQGRGLTPILEGGGQQDNIRSGSLDTSMIVAFSKVAKIIFARRTQRFEEVQKLHQHLINRVQNIKNKTGTRLKAYLPPSNNISPYIAHFSLQEYQGAILARMLGLSGIMVGTGSACAAETRSPSRITKAMGYTDTLSYGALRVSFGHQNTRDEVDFFVDRLEHALHNY